MASTGSASFAENTSGGYSGVHDPDSPIGVFDSGLGGLTVLSALHQRLPHEDLIYFGDTARVPYGSKSRETVIQYSMEIAEFLMQKGVKAIVIACNTASSHALPEIRKNFPVPVIGVVEPGALALAQKFPGIERAAVIATRSTIKSGAYENEIMKHLPGTKLFSRACPLLVPLIEEGFVEKNATELIIRDYLDEIVREGIQHLILGCTHYPILKKVIHRMYPGLILIDSSIESANLVSETLKEKNLLKSNQGKGTIRLYVSDITDSLVEMEKLFFGNTIHSVEKKVLGW